MRRNVLEKPLFKPLLTPSEISGNKNIIVVINYECQQNRRMESTKKT